MSKKTKLQPGQVWRGYGGVIRRFIGWTSKGDYVVEDLSAGAIDRLRNTAENIEILFLFLVRDDRGVRVKEVTELGIEDEKTSPLPPVKNIIPAPKMIPPMKPREYSEVFQIAGDDPGIWTDALLYNIARNDTLVNHFLHLRARADLTHDQALVGLILYLSERNRQMMEEAKDFYLNFPGPSPLPPCGEKAEKEKG